MSLQIKNILEEKIPNTQIFFDNEGCALVINIINDEIVNLTPINRQKKIYSHLQHLFESGELHAVNMKFFTVQQWNNKNKQNG